MKKPEYPDNVIAFPGTRHEAPLVGEPDCTYGEKERQEFLDEMAKEMHVALRIQDIFGVDEANEWVKFHRGIGFTKDND